MTITKLLSPKMNSIYIYIYIYIMTITKLLSPKIKQNTTERRKIDTHNTQIHDRSLSMLGTGTPIQSGGVKLDLLAQTSPLSQ